jgi:hypothetical protein
MGPERLTLGLGILAVFALVFAATSRQAKNEHGVGWRITQAAAILLPFAFVFYFASDVRFASQLLPIGGLLVLLSAAAAWLGRTQNAHDLAAGAAAGGVAVLLAWCVPPQPPVAPWPLIGWR